MVGRAVMADVTNSAENKGTAMNKVADLFVRLGQRGVILAGILMMEHAPSEPTKEFWQYRAAQSPQRHTEFLREPGLDARVGYSVRAGAIMLRAHERESSS
jgi:xylose isomerase